MNNNINKQQQCDRARNVLSFAWVAVFIGLFVGIFTPWIAAIVAIAVTGLSLFSANCISKINGSNASAKLVFIRMLSTLTVVVALAALSHYMPIKLDVVMAHNTIAALSIAAILMANFVTMLVTSYGSSYDKDNIAEAQEPA